MLRPLILVLALGCLGNSYVLKKLTGTGDLVVSCGDDGSYNVTVGGKLWLKNAPIFFHIRNKTWSTADGSLLLQNIYKDYGKDAIGKWNSLNFNFTAGATPVVASFRAYDGIPAVLFGQEFPEGAAGTATGNKDEIVSGFPGFNIDGTLAELGYLSYGYLFVGNMDRRYGRWNATSFSVRDGLNGGPMMLFDRGGRTLWICPFDQFMSVSNRHYKSPGQYYWGVMGNVKSIPAGYAAHTMLYYGDGPNQAMASWGQLMRKYYKKHTDYRDADFANNYLSYWSDNGAYYVNYYVKGGLIQNMTYQDGMLHYVDYSNSLRIPYRSIQYSVWFKQGHHGHVGGNKEWVANPALFPSGMKYMFEETALPVTAHSRWWSVDTVYAKKNGGDYDFIVEHDYALPIEERFWRDMFSWSQQWGLKTYMQDWLNWQFTSMSATTEDVNIGRDWLMQMGAGAADNGVTVQYCMSLSRHILQSLEIPAVTQARTSNDYSPGDTSHWRIGQSSIFADAVGLASFKDTFWTTEIQPDNIYHKSEPHPTLMSAVVSLSAGPVGPGDMTNGTDVELLMRCCRTDGLILKPDKPAMSIDAQIMEAGFKEGSGPDGEVWTTHSFIDGYFFGIIFATDMHNTYDIGPTAASFGASFPKSRVYAYDDSPFILPQKFSDAETLPINWQCTMSEICLYYTTPVINFRDQEILLLGERSKWIPMSRQRVDSIQMDAEDLTIKLRGKSGETVQFSYVIDNQPSSVTCRMSVAGSAVISFNKLKCTPL